ncbi:MAG: 30S ribosomal protein S5 [Defluviitaleaceae bacterium]|nr:30S ribosomal protein S5 [Defluviitaleaceae bacterium]MCL2262699.1 30S ribosomal protein S5 [Defluviitaleaceae bacterium]
MAMKKIDANSLDIKDRVVSINRVTKVVKGGRTFRFAALVVVGDEAGHVGVGLGKANEIPEAIRKGKEDAKKNMIFLEKNEDDSLYHEIIGHFGAAKVLMRPAPEGTGLIAGGAVRAVLELAGVRNVVTKSIGSNNKHNVVKATLTGLQSMKTPSVVARLRGKPVEEIYEARNS